MLSSVLHSQADLHAAHHPSLHLLCSPLQFLSSGNKSLGLPVSSVICFLDNTFQYLSPLQHTEYCCIYRFTLSNLTKATAILSLSFWPLPCSNPGRKHLVVGFHASLCFGRPKPISRKSRETICLCQARRRGRGRLSGLVRRLTTF